MAEDVDAEAARKQFRLEQQRRSQVEALGRAKAQQAHRSRQAASEAKRKSREALDTREDTDSLVREESFGGGMAVVDELGAGVSRGQMRAAIVWSEILGNPRALRPYEDPSGLS